MKILRFAGVGSIGFLVDASSLFLLSFYITPVVARTLAFWIVASSNWWLNRQITFAAKKSPLALQQWGRFIGVSCIGFIPNWICYWLLMTTVDINQLSEFYVQQYPEFNSLIINHIEIIWFFSAMVAGVLLGMLTNYLLADRWVFRPVVA